MKEKERIALIRKANELFNNGNIKEAQQIYLETNYIDGLIRVGDYYYSKRQPLFALPFFKKAGCKEKVEEIEYRMIMAFQELIRNSKKKKDEKELHSNKQENVKNDEAKKLPENSDNGKKKLLEQTTDNNNN